MEFDKIEEYEELIAWNLSFGISKDQTIKDLKVNGVSNKILSYLLIYG